MALPCFLHHGCARDHAGMISPLNPELVHITDDLNEAVDIALSGLM